MILFNAQKACQLGGSKPNHSFVSSENHGASGFHGNIDLLAYRSHSGNQHCWATYSKTVTQSSSDWESNHS